MIKLTKCLGVAVGLMLSGFASGSARIAVLDFELNDITSLPNTPAEKQRTGEMAPLLVNALGRLGDYQAVAIATETQKAANSSFGYLFRFHDLAAQLGKQQGADWIIVSQHSKPSFLFSYLWVYLIDVKTQKAIARYDVELKGNSPKVSARSIANLAKKIAAAIDNDLVR